MRTLWDEAAYREERYAAEALAGDRRYWGYQDPDCLDLYEHLVVTGAWWDHVDLDRHPPDRTDPALQPTGARRHHARLVDRPEPVAAPDRRSSTRSAPGETTDRRLLVDCILPNLDDREFFIRKAIGWALRQYARIEPAWVRGFVAEHEDRMSGLTRREATKHLS